ncbi:hypothetical protein OO015_00465 [Thermomicrobium sp. 4228-Ro]|uniref:hypothetical protein n=1 Tax=Thermomicrobium sp. 4228-Ro TaxID=2993937 RepID=UPI0022492D1D|nr:hypothetical protein [Thermomicrobium sp. 4228-Ro]MCX2725980.1 hypothetical protein [Thermomicrobium sp. 4228-Ro]
MQDPRSVSFLESLDIAFRAEPLAVTTYGDGEHTTARYRYLVEAYPTEHREGGIRGVLAMVARRSLGVSFAWEEVRWADGAPLSEAEAWVAMELLLRHIAAQLLYQHAYVAVKAGEVPVREEQLDA